jgi:hypothetical protein
MEHIRLQNTVQAQTKTISSKTNAGRTIVSDMRSMGDLKITSNEEWNVAEWSLLDFPRKSILEVNAASSQLSASLLTQTL